MAENETPREHLERTEYLAGFQESLNKMEADRWKRIDRAVVWANLVLSVALLAVAFFPIEKTAIYQAAPLGTRFILGVLGAVILLLTLFTLIVRPRDREERHRQSLHHFFEIKHDAKTALTQSDPTFEQAKSLRQRYLDAEHAYQIPESRFLKLKRRHHLKIEKSKLTGANPGVPLWVLHLQLLLGTSWYDESEEDGEENGRED